MFTQNIKHILRMKRIIKNLLRLFWYIPYRILKLFRIGTVLTIPHGWDTIYPLAPCSEGGIIRKDFEIFLKMNKETKKVEFDDKKWGKSRELFLEVMNRQETLKSWWPK